MERANYIYRVSLTVDRELALPFETYMREKHIGDVLATGRFLSARMTGSDGRYVVEYLASGRAAIDDYVAADAPRLREDVFRHFPSGVSAERETVPLIGEWGAE